MSKIIIFVVLFSLTNLALAAKTAPLPDNSRLHEIFEQIKNVPISYDPEGAVCEQVARVELQKEFPIEQYDVVVGIDYALKNRVLGEMDMVVFDKRTNNVVLVSEVKCWKSFKDGLAKAMEQRGLFTWVLQNNPQTVKLTSHEGRIVSPEQFLANKNYQTISQFGGVKYGFDKELPYTLVELKRLRTMLLRCKVWSGCAEKVGD